MTEDDHESAAGYRRRAVALRKSASEVRDDISKRGLLALAATYEQVAVSIESIQAPPKNS